ncbi:extensin-like isoform X2 [Nilaparvata lugens]|uniref:extensin-like isoform X2 n=1 Tax=Nilaparvata lugens TaxID=108931 RepID=UPI00193E7567|nr:extensin-like isoform X2 [Nilaparvata lugens]XP_039296519.1 extensin-like isoform X2 [Nilaparvata lugens]
MTAQRNMRKLVLLEKTSSPIFSGGLLHILISCIYHQSTNFCRMDTTTPPPATTVTTRTLRRPYSTLEELLAPHPETLHPKTLHPKKIIPPPKHSDSGGDPPLSPLPPSMMGGGCKCKYCINPPRNPPPQNPTPQKDNPPPKHSDSGGDPPLSPLPPSMMGGGCKCKYCINPPRNPPPQNPTPQKDNPPPNIVIVVEIHHYHHYPHQ